MVPLGQLVAMRAQTWTCCHHTKVNKSPRGYLIIKLLVLPWLAREREGVVAICVPFETKKYTLLTFPS